jgi:hypothetical protein
VRAPEPRFPSLRAAPNRLGGAPFAVLLYLLKAFLEVVWGHHRWGFFAGVVILLLLVVNSPSGQMLANAAKWSQLASADVELGLLDRAPCF